MRKVKRVRGIPFTRIVPNMITSGNLLCGMLSLVMVLHGKLVPAAWLVFAAVFFDYMDGKMARSLGGSSAFGVELDSLADVVSFGVAPGLIVYSAYLHGFLGVTGALVAAFFALCGALRLARFNVMHVPGAFQGLPIPAAGLFVSSFVMAGFSLPPMAMALVTVGTAMLMVSTVPYGNLKKLRKGNVNRAKVMFLTTFVAVLFVVLREKAPFAGIFLYVLSGLVRFDWGAWLSLDASADVERHHEG